jgi:hypothetical protein
MGLAACLCEHGHSEVGPLAPIAVKDKSEPVRVYAIHPKPAARIPVSAARAA